MKYRFSSFARLLVVAVLIAFIVVYLSRESRFDAFLADPLVILALVLIALIVVAMDAVLKALNKILYHSMSEEEKKHFAEESGSASWLRKICNALTGRKDREAIEAVTLDHDFDGIQELDNSLPPWWIYSFYITILFSFVYLMRFHVFGASTQDQEYQIEVQQAKIAVEEYKKTAKDLIDANTVELLTDANDIAEGKTIFEQNCVACHMADGGGGIGPNLTDKYWILGGGIKNVFKTIAQGGRDGKGMIAWKQSLKPLQIAQVASYVLSLQGTMPQNPKKSQGDLWEE